MEILIKEVKKIKLKVNEFEIDTIELLDNQNSEIFLELGKEEIIELVLNLMYEVKNRYSKFDLLGILNSPDFKDIMNLIKNIENIKHAK